MNNSWGSFIGGIRKPLCITSQWNYVLYLRFGLPFKMATSMCDFAKASNLFSINKFVGFQVDVLNKLLQVLKVTLGRKVLVTGLRLKPTTLFTPVRCSTNWASRATGHSPCPNRTSLHFLFLVHKKIPVWRHWDWRVFNCNMRFHWKKIGLLCLLHIHENEILLVKFPTVSMDCNGIKYCGCWRWPVLCKNGNFVLSCLTHWHRNSYAGN